MKKAAVLVFAAVFAVGLIHFYYAEDHCPVHCPTRGGRIGHVNAHHAGTTVCLCFLSALSGPEVSDLPAAVACLAVLDRPAPDRVLGMTVAEITPPPRSSLHV